LPAQAAARSLFSQLVLDSEAGVREGLLGEEVGDVVRAAEFERHHVFDL
jgi:hypothetical protein